MVWSVNKQDAVVQQDSPCSPLRPPPPSINHLGRCRNSSSYGLHQVSLCLNLLHPESLLRSLFRRHRAEPPQNRRDQPTLWPQIGQVPGTSRLDGVGLFALELAERNRSRSSHKTVRGSLSLCAISHFAIKLFEPLYVERQRSHWHRGFCYQWASLKLYGTLLQTSTFGFKASRL